MFKSRTLHLIKRGGQHLVMFKISDFYNLTLSRCVLTSLCRGIHHCCTSVSASGGQRGTTRDSLEGTAAALPENLNFKNKGRQSALLALAVVKEAAQ